MAANIYRLAFATLALVFGSASAEAEPAKAVLELFTSQGCSSCPPADKLFKSIATRSDVITLTLPVDYWDRLGWKDTLASPAFTARQRGYSQRRGDGEVYTPQAVVNGTAHFVGSRRSDVDAVLESHSQLPVQVGVVTTPDGIRVSVGSGGAGARGLVVAMPILAESNVSIGRGENAGTQVSYTNVVRDIDTIAPWSGQAIELNLPSETYERYDSLVILVQSGTVQTPGPIAGAARVKLK